MRRLRRQITKILVPALLVLAVLPTSSAFASSAPVPFKDPYSSGTLTLCDRSGRPLTSGSMQSVPFAWSAVSSSAAPPKYTRAYLTVFQPIQYVDPSDWDGNQLTTVAIFSNPLHPVAQATNADAPLFFTYNSYPPRWDNLYELRMYFASPNSPAHNSSYPSAVIQVSGNRWTLLSGGGTPCNAGTAVSVASLVLPKSELDTPQTLGVGPRTIPTTTSVPDSTFPFPISRSTKQAGGALRASAANGGGISSGSLAGIVAGAVAVIGVATGLVIRRRRGGSVAREQTGDV